MTSPLLLLLCVGRGLAADRGLYERTTDLIAEHYLRLDDLSVERAYDEALDAAAAALPWLVVRREGEERVLIHGAQGEFARLRLVEPGRSATLTDLAPALARVEDAIRDQGAPLPDELDLAVELLRGAARALDRHSSVLAGGRLERFDERISGKMSGIGATMGLVDGSLVVKALFPDCPAERGGLKVGDRVIRIDGLSTRGITVARAVERIRGEVGTEVTLVIERPRADGVPELLTLTFARAEVVIPNVTWRRLPGGAGLIAIDHFSEATHRLMREAIAELTAAPAPITGLVIDLRDNGGGSMIQSSLAADLLLEGGLVVRTTGRDGAAVDNLVRELKARDDGREPELPVVVLVDHKSASASEILAGSLALHGRAVLIGERTFGKGTVQKTYTLREAPREVRLKMTVAEYRLDGDVRVADVGLSPDLWVDTARFDRLGAHLPGDDLPVGALVFVEQAEGWGSGVTDRGDTLLALAERVIADTRGHRRADLLAALERTSERARAEESARLEEVFAQGGLRWDALDAATQRRYPRGFPVEPPPVSASVRLDGVARAGSQVTVSASFHSDWTLPLHRARLRLRAADEDSPWHGVVLPLGYVAPQGGATATASVQLPTGLAPREELVEVVLEADGLPVLPMGETVFAVEERPRPPLVVRARLVTEADEQRVELNLENRGELTLTEVEARFRYPEDGRIELLDRDARADVIAPGGRARLDLGLRLGEDAPALLPLELVVEAEVYGVLLDAPLEVSQDGSPTEISPPELRVSLPLRATVGALVARVEVSDEHGLDELTAWFGGDKIVWRDLDGRRERLEIPLIVPEGTTTLKVRVRDDQGAEQTVVTAVRGVAVDGAADGHR